jgi:hypothetical protein
VTTPVPRLFPPEHERPAGEARGRPGQHGGGIRGDGLLARPAGVPAIASIFCKNNSVAGVAEKRPKPRAVLRIAAIAVEVQQHRRAWPALGRQERQVEPVRRAQHRPFPARRGRDHPRVGDEDQPFLPRPEGTDQQQRQPRDDGDGRQHAAHGPLMGLI